MNVKLVESLAQIVQSISPEERSLKKSKINGYGDGTSAAGQERPFYETATPEEWVRAFRECPVTRAIVRICQMKPSVEKAFTQKEVKRG